MSQSKHSNICNICGAPYEYINGKWKCPACGAYKEEELSNEEATLLFNAAQKLRLNSFDEAEDLYRDIIRKYPECGDAHWGLVLCKYGIKYEQDYNGKMIPTCYFPSYDSFLEDKNYKLALDYSSAEQKRYYQEQAQKIENIRIEWAEKAKQEPPYDVFISYKDTKSGTNERTEDSYDAFEIYTYLKEHGYKVFFSRETLKGKTGERYEPYIFNALNTASVMLVFGSKVEYIEATWVKNEWSRFYKRIKDKTKLDNSMVVLFKNLNPSDLPRPLNSIQSMDVTRLTFLEDLVAYIERILQAVKTAAVRLERTEIKTREKRKNTKVTLDVAEVHEITHVGTGVKAVTRETVRTREIGTYNVPQLSSTAEGQLKVAYGYLSMGSFADAKDGFEAFLVNNKFNGRALCGKLLAIYKCKTVEEFLSEKLGTINDGDFDLLIRILEYSEKEQSEQILQSICELIKQQCKKGNYANAQKWYAQVADFDSNNIETLRVFLYQQGLSIVASNTDIAEFFVDKSLEHERDTECYIKLLHNIIDSLIAAELYQRANKYIEQLSQIDQDSFDTLIRTLKVNYSVKSNMDVLQVVEIRKDYSVTEDILQRLNVNDALALFALQLEFAHRLIDNANYSAAEKWLDNTFKYNFENRLAELRKAIALVVSKASSAVEALFDSLLRYIEMENKEEYLIAFADSSLKNKAFDTAIKYYNKLIEQYDRPAFYLGRLYATVGVSDNTEFLANIGKLKDFDALEEYFASIENKPTLVKKVEELLQACVKRIAYVSDSKDNLFVVFDKIISYIPEDYDDVILKHLMDVAKATQAKRFFDKSEKYFALVVSIDVGNHAGYWGLLQSKLKCANNVELIKQKTPIKELAEFNNALTAATNNDQALNGYINVRVEQERYFANQKRKKRVINITKIACVILCIVLALTAVTVTGVSHYNKQNQLLYSLTKDGSGYAVYCGKVYKVAGALTIPSTYDGKPVTQIADNAFKGQTKLTQITLPTSIEVIGNSAFEGCNNLENISYSTATATVDADMLVFASSDSVAVHKEIGLALTTIGDRAFFGCTKLVSFNFEEGLISIGNFAFAESGLQYVEIPQTVDYIGKNAFANCNDIVEIVVSNRESIPTAWATDWNIGKEQDTTYKLRVDFDYADATVGVGNSYVYVTKDETFQFPVVGKDGYTFNGWYRGADKVTDEKGISLGVWDFTSGGTVTARLTANNNAIVFDNNGGMGKMDNFIIATDATAQLPTCAFEKDGYHFVGWAETADGEVQYVDAALYTMGPETSYTLYAIWEIPKANYTIRIYTENADSADYVLKFESENQAYAGSDITIGSIDLVGFVTPQEQTITINPDGSTVVSFYHLRKTKNVSFVSNGGTTISDTQIKYGQSLTTPNRDNFTFGGWFLDCDLTIAAASTWEDENTAWTLYAWWQEENKPSDFTYVESSNTITICSYVGTSVEMNIPDYINDRPVTAIQSRAFEQKNIFAVTIPKNITSIGNFAFYYCTALAKINYYATNCENLDSSNYIFYYAGARGTGISVYIGANVSGIPDYLFYPYFSGGSPQITNVVFEENSHCTSIGSSAFSSCTSLTSITIPASVTSIGNSAFFGCSVLTSITIPKSCTSIGDCAFSNCSSLESINVAEENMLYRSEGNCLIESATNTLVAGCKTSVIPMGVTDIGDSAFYWCSSLVSITIPTSVTKIGDHSFKFCISLTSITIPNGITGIGDSAFYGCTALTEIFYNAKNCADLGYLSCGFLLAGKNGVGITVTIGADVERIPTNLFGMFTSSTSDLPKITKVVFQKNSQCKSIGSFAFYGCSSLTSVTIPISVTSIERCAFYDCSSLTDVYCEANSKPSGWASDWIESTVTVHWGYKGGN